LLERIPESIRVPLKIKIQGTILFPYRLRGFPRLTALISGRDDLSEKIVILKTSQILIEKQTKVEIPNVIELYGLENNILTVIDETVAPAQKLTTTSRELI